MTDFLLLALSVVITLATGSMEKTLKDIALAIREQKNDRAAGAQEE